MAREIDDQSVADCIANQASAGAARRDRKSGINSRANDSPRFPGRTRKSGRLWLNLINGRVGREQNAGQAIRAHVATGLLQFAQSRVRHAAISRGPSIPSSRGQSRGIPVLKLDGNLVLLKSGTLRAS